jgi:hypothetical protein
MPHAKWRSKSRDHTIMVELGLQLSEQREVPQRSAESNGHTHGAFIGSENIRCFLAFFDKVNGSKIVPPAPITCRDDGGTMFEQLLHKNDGQAKIVKWEFEVEEGWLLYRSLLSYLIASEKEFVHPGEMAKWMESGCWCQVCFDPLGPEGAFQLGSCGHVFPGLSHRTSFGKITSEGRRPGTSGRPCVRTNV